MPETAGKSDHSEVGKATTDTSGWFPLVLAAGGLGLLVLTTVRVVRRRRIP